jgi:putative holliday junction resolvase
LKEEEVSRKGAKVAKGRSKIFFIPFATFAPLREILFIDMGRVLGLDFGTRRVGAAVSDPRRTIATPLEVYQRQSPERDALHYKTLVEEHGVEALVVGLPLHTGGGEGDLAALARAWGTWLAGQVGRPVTFFDERYTSVDAEDILKTHGFKLRDRKARRDMLAAQILLQGYLDAGCPVVEPPAAPLADPPGEEPEP